jgi:uncharacterized LabA/DUF88 family protein
MKRNFTYIDNSNLFVEGCRVAAVRKHLPGAWTIFDAMSNRVVDVTWRLDYERLRDFVSDTKADEKIALWGSTNDQLSASIERKGIKVVNFRRNSSGKEKRVDVAIAHAITKDAYSGLIRKEEDEITLIAGDSDFVPVVDDLVSAGYLIHVVFWGHAARDLKNAASRFISLDPFHTLISASNFGQVSTPTTKTMH